MPREGWRGRVANWTSGSILLSKRIFLVTSSGWMSLKGYPGRREIVVTHRPGWLRFPTGLRLASELPKLRYRATGLPWRTGVPGSLTDDLFRRIGDSVGSISIAPESEFHFGQGSPPTAQVLESGKQADIVILRTDTPATKGSDLNFVQGAVALRASRAEIDTVMIVGKTKKSQEIAPRPGPRCRPSRGSNPLPNCLRVPLRAAVRRVPAWSGSANLLRCISV